MPTEGRAGPGASQGQGACGCATTAPCRRQSFRGKAGYQPEIYTLGHRNQLGLAVHPGTGAVWENENGPNGGDEINVIMPGRNYGWPVVSLADVHRAVAVGKFDARGLRAADRLLDARRSRCRAWRSTPATSCRSGRATCSSARCEWARFRAPATSAHPVQRQHGGAAPGDAATELHQRIRDVRQGPDGLLYVLTDENPGAVLRIEPL